MEAGDQRLTYWLFKSEADVWSWENQVAKGETGEEWDGVCNYQARNFMRQMNVGDLGFFYHSRADKEIVGIVEVCRAAHQDSSTEEARWECVDVKAVRALPSPVTLEMCKQDPRLEQMVLVNNARLSVQPVTTEEWQIICALGAVAP